MSALGPTVTASTKCGFVALIGAPNAGKSTLMNAQVGARLSIVTRKVQTTRSQLRGIMVVGTTQLVFIDTPGIFAPRRRLDRAMVDAAWAAAADADVIVVIVDAYRADAAQQRGALGDDDRRIVERLGRERAGRFARSKIVLALNKIDRLDRTRLLPLAETFNAGGAFDETFMISALTGDGLDALQGYLVANAPEGAWHYPEEQLSDLPERLLAAEVTREQAFELLHQELPYALTVETESWREHRNGDVRIDQVIHVEKDSQKRMVIGKGGGTVKRIRERAQASLAALLERKVHLFVTIKVSPKWADEPARYREWGLKFDA